MRHLLPIAIALLPGLAPAQEPRRFDGDWDVAVFCPAVKVDAREVKPVSYIFRAVVLNGYLAAINGKEGEPGFRHLHGPVSPDGTAMLLLEGRIANPKASVQKDAQVGEKFKWSVTARLDGNTGTGERVDGRRCDLRFSR